MGEIIYNGRSSKEIGLEVETFPSYQAPRRKYETIHVPGRNGDLLLDEGSWENTTRSYEVSIGSFRRHYYEMMNAVSEWLHSSYTYARLEDSYEPEYYRLGVYLEETSMSNIFNHGGKGRIDFNCKPQRFLKIGDYATVVTKDTIIQNPTRYESLPIIKVYGTGSGTLEVGDCYIQITDIGNEIIIDSEIQDAYLGDQNKNQVISIPKGFPQLSTGQTKISFSGGISKVEVIPKWFTL